MEVRDGFTVTPIDLNGSPAEKLASIPDKVHVGDVVKVTAVDWGIMHEQISKEADFRIVRGIIYGQVVKVNDNLMTIAPQVFEDEDVRCALTIPVVTIERVEILEKADG